MKLKELGKVEGDEIKKDSERSVALNNFAIAINNFAILLFNLLKQKEKE